MKKENPFQVAEQKAKIEKPKQPEKKEFLEDKLPIEKYEAEIKELIKNNEISIVVGETGSGKTTMIPIFLSEVLGSENKVAITQPRRVAATSVARYVAKLKNTKLGDEVGYQIRFDKKTKHETPLNFMTDGILLRELQDDPYLRSYDSVMVDEAHERNLNIDFILGLLKNAQKLRKESGMKELKVLVSSATLEKEKFSQYFDEAPMVEVPGRLHPVEVNYEDKNPDNYMVAAARKVGEVIKKSKDAEENIEKLSEQEILKNQGDILIFMPGQREIEETIQLINNMLDRKDWSDEVEVLPLYGRLSPEQQDKIFKKSSKRKIIVSTNIAETSLTVPGITTVIDSGLIKQIDYDESTGIQSLHAVPHAQSGCEQRMGRAGRLAPGQCYRLFSKNSFNERRDFQKPEILRSSLTSVVLTMKKMGLQNIKDFDFIDKPDPQKFDNAINSLKHLGALNENEELTQTGELMSELPLEPSYSKMLVEANKLGEVKDVTIITAFLSAGKSVFVRPRQEANEADMAHEKFEVEGSDYLTMLNVWKKYQKTKEFLEIEVKTEYDSKIDQKTRGIKDETKRLKKQAELNRKYRKRIDRKINKRLGKWAYNNFLNNKVLKSVSEIKYQLSSILRRNRIALRGNHKEENIQKCITAGLLENLVKSWEYHRYYKYYDSDIDNLYIHPSSTVFGKEPAYAVAGEVVQTRKSYMRNMQEVKLEWLLDVAPHLFKEKKSSRVYEDNDGRLYKEKMYVLQKWDVEIEGKKEYLKNTDLAMYFIKNKELLPAEVHEKNKEVLDYAYDLIYRYDSDTELEYDIWDLYKEKISNVRVKNLEDVKKIVAEVDWEIPLNYFLNSKQQELILRNYPDEMEIGGEMHKVYYNHNNPEEYKAYVELGNENILTLEEKIRSGLELPSGDKLAIKIGNIIETDADKILKKANKRFKEEQLAKVNFDKLEKEIPYELGDELPELPEVLPYGVDYLAEEEVYLYPYYEFDEDEKILKLKYTADDKVLSSAEFLLNNKLKEYKEAKRLEEEDKKKRLNEEKKWKKYYNKAMEKLESLTDLVEELKQDEEVLDHIFEEAGEYLDYFNKALEIVDNSNEYLVNDSIKENYHEMKKLLKHLNKLKIEIGKKKEFANLSALDKLKATFNTKK